jgi:electron transport complex protein RnfC
MIKLKEHKSLTENKSIEMMPLPPYVYIPLSQHLGKACEPVVKVGDSVFTGQVIATVQAHVYAPVHSSLSGKVVAIQNWPHPVLGRSKAIVIENDGMDKSQIPNPCLSGRQAKSQAEVNKLTPEQIKKIVFEAGIVGLGGAAFPTHIKLTPPRPVDTLIINGAECEPYLTCDYRLMVEKTKEISSGLELVARCLAVKDIYIAIEDNKPQAIERFRTQDTRLKIKVLKSRYPQGGERQLIKNILGKEVPQGKLPFDIGVVVHNVATIFAIYEAVYMNKPLYERVVTVTGSCLSAPKNILARIGTPIKALIDFCGPLLEEPFKIIIGGPMMGIAQYTDQVPVIKSTSGIILFSQKESVIQQEEFCIRCGACVRECPAGLMPCLINLASEKEMWPQAKTYGAPDCMECGLCNFVCPANRRLVQSIKRAKLEVVK